MKISDLKIKKTEISDEIKVVRSLMDKEDRVLTTEEVAKVEELTRDFDSVEASIVLIEKTELLERAVIVPEKPVANMKKTKGSLELLRNLIDEGKQTVSLY